MIKVKNTFNFMKVEKKVRSGLGLYAHTAAKKMEADAKRNRPWTDHTANARNSILGDFGWEKNLCTIRLSGGMVYFPRLELDYEKEYAILIPTIRKNAAEIMRGYERAIKGLK